MKKLLIVSTYLPPKAGGAEHVAWELAQRLSRDFEVHMMATSGGSECFNVALHHIPYLPLLTISYSTVAKHMIKSILDEVSPDIVHIHRAVPWGYILRNERSAKISTCHGSDVFPVKQYPERLFLMSALRHADVVTTPSRWLAEYVEAKYGQRCITIPNGVDTNTFRRLPRARKSDNVVLFVGRFMRVKGILDIVEAARALPKYEFRLVGSAQRWKPSPSRTDAVNIPRLPNLKIVGFIPDKHALAIQYNQATICAFPSHRENFPLVGLEAMACGKAVVATRLGFSEYIENGREGLIVEPHDIKGLVNSIQYLMENKAERERFEENASKKAGLYDWEIVARQYEALYYKEITASQ